MDNQEVDQPPYHEVLSENKQLAAAFLTKGSLGLQGEHKVKEFYNKFRSSGLSVVPAIEKVIETYQGLLDDGENKLTAAFIAVGKNSLFRGGGESFLKAKRELLQVNFDGGPFDDLSASIIVGYSAKKRLILKGGALQNIAKEWDKLQNGESGMSPFSASLLTPTVVSAGFLSGSIRSRVEASYHHFEEVAGDGNASAVLTNTLLQHYSEYKSEQKITERYQQFNELLKAS